MFDAATAEEATDIYDRENGEFQLIFSDVVLPGESGPQLADRLVSHNPRLRILLSSGYVDEKSRWSEIQKKGIPFLPKPFSIVSLLQSVRNAIDQH